MHGWTCANCYGKERCLRLCDWLQRVWLSREVLWTLRVRGTGATPSWEAMGSKDSKGLTVSPSSCSTSINMGKKTKQGTYLTLIKRIPSHPFTLFPLFILFTPKKVWRMKSIFFYGAHSFVPRFAAAGTSVPLYPPRSLQHFTATTPLFEHL